MKKTNYYFTLFLCLFTTLFAFIHMFEIVSLSKSIIMIIFNNLLPSLLPFMILISLCLSIGIMHLLSYILQFIMGPLFHLTPMMCSLYFLSFFCGYPTNVKLIKEAYEYHYISLDELQHLLSIASFASMSFIFVSLGLPFQEALLLYLCHIAPSFFIALFYQHPKNRITFKETLSLMKNPSLSFVDAMRKSITSSLYAFIFILGYMLVFQFLGYTIAQIIHYPLVTSLIKGLLEFSSGSLSMINHPFHFIFIAFFLSFGGLSVFMQIDNLLEKIPYSPKQYLKDRLIHAIFSFFLAIFVYNLLL